MKLIAFSDLHKSEEGLAFIKDKISDIGPDLILFCGDITTFGPISFAQKAISAIDIQTLAVPGNCDPPSVHPVFNEGSFTNIHGRSKEVGGFTFIGWGGSNPGINTPFENSEDVIKADLGPVVAAEAKRSNPIILVSHCPPFGFQDTVPNGEHVGCTSVADMIDTHRPALTVCGHIHEARGIYTDIPRKLSIVNVGPSKDGYCAVIDLGSPREVLDDPINKISIELIG